MKIVLVCALALSACERGTNSDEMYIAEQIDFAKYMTWGAIDLGMGTGGTGHPVGEEYGYRNKMAKNGEYPVGTILVKEIHIDAIKTDWDLFAMAKRGGAYNAGGAEGWEFFTLKLDDELVPIIQTRGTNPADADSNSHGYGQAENGITCNRCHGVPGTEATDHTLSAGLAP